MNQVLLAVLFAISFTVLLGNQEVFAEQLNPIEDNAPNANVAGGNDTPNPMDQSFTYGLTGCQNTPYFAKFDVSSIPNFPGSGTLRLHVEAEGSNTYNPNFVNLRAIQVTNDWSDSTITFNNQPPEFPGKTAVVVSNPGINLDAPFDVLIPIDDITIVNEEFSVKVEDTLSLTCDDWLLMNTVDHSNPAVRPFLSFDSSGGGMTDAEWQEIIDRANARKEIYELYRDKAFNESWWESLADEANNVGQESAKDLSSTEFFGPLKDAVEIYNNLVDIPFPLNLFSAVAKTLNTLLALIFDQIGNAIDFGNTKDFNILGSLNDLITNADGVITAAQNQDIDDLNSHLEQEKNNIDFIYPRITGYFDRTSIYLGLVATLVDDEIHRRMVKDILELYLNQLENNFLVITTQLGSPMELDKSKNNLDVIFVKGKSPINLLIVDPQIRRIGFDPDTGLTVNEIPNAEYSGPNTEPQILFIPTPLDGNYQVLVTGTGTGSFTLEFLSTIDGIDSKEVITGNIMLDERQFYDFLVQRELPVGGELIPIETTSLILAGAQSFSWMIPVVLSVVGIGLFVVSRKS